MGSAPKARLLFGSDLLPALLQLLLSHPDRQYGWKEIQENLAGPNPDSLYRAMDRALALGVIKRYPKGGRYGTYAADTSSAIYRDLKRLLDKLNLRPAAGTYEPVDLPALARLFKEDKPPDGALGEQTLAWIHQFVDDFRASKRSVQRNLIKEEPAPTGSTVLDAYLAGLAEHLAAEARLPAPRWVNRPERFLGSWWIESDLPTSRPAALALSPAAFRRHGVFISDRALTRA